jgi:hypothetical protein
VIYNRACVCPEENDERIHRLVAAAVERGMAGHIAAVRIVVVVEAPHTAVGACHIAAVQAEAGASSILAVLGCMEVVASTAESGIGVVADKVVEAIVEVSIHRGQAAEMRCTQGVVVAPDTEVAAMTSSGVPDSDSARRRIAGYSAGSLLQ